jgi:hypothetical protein
MDVGRIIAAIEWLERLFKLPDERSPLISDSKAENRKTAAMGNPEKLFGLPDQKPPRMADWKAASDKYDETYSDDRRFKLWRPDDV